MSENGQDDAAEPTESRAEASDAAQSQNGYRNYITGARQSLSKFEEITYRTISLGDNSYRVCLAFPAIRRDGTRNYPPRGEFARRQRRD